MALDINDVRLERSLLIDLRKYAVVGRHEVVTAGFDDDGPPGRSHAWINDDDVDCPGREKSAGLGDYKSPFGDGVGRDFVADVDDPNRWVNGCNNSFHHTDIVARETEIRG